MSQKDAKKKRKNVRNELGAIFENLWKEPFPQRLKMAWSILAKKNYFINKVNRRKR
jgi:hypothetical protein